MGAEEKRRHQDQLRELRAGLKSLSREQREAIRIMFERNGRPIKQTCADLGIPYSTVRSRMLTGIEVLRRHLCDRGLLNNRAGSEDP